VTARLLERERVIRAGQDVVGDGLVTNSEVWKILGGQKSWTCLRAWCLTVSVPLGGGSRPSTVEGAPPQDATPPQTLGPITRLAKLLLGWTPAASPGDEFSLGID
jgi:hypothetical protein